MVSNNRYSLYKAMQDLLQSDLLHSVLLLKDGQLVESKFSEGLKFCAGESFFGAGLDSRNLKANSLFVALNGEFVDGREYVSGPLAAGHIVLTRPLASGQSDPLLSLKAAPGGAVLLSDDPEKALACLAASWRKTLSVKVVAVTGTNGKTTTKDLIRAMLSGSDKTQATKGNFNNHLGLPLTLLNLETDTRYAVIEMGASSIGEIKFLAELTGAEVGVITNASAAHLSEFGSLENIIKGKGELLDCLPFDGVAVLNSDSPGFARWNDRAVCRVVSWGQEKGNHRWSWTAEKSQQPGLLILDGEAWNVPLPGRHNGANLCAAILACRALGAKDDDLRKALESFKGSAHRGLLVHWEGRIILDDAYNANPASMLVAVKTLLDMPGSGHTVAVLGAMAEMGPDSEIIHQETGEKLLKEKLDYLLAVGESAWPLTKCDAKNCTVLKMDNHLSAARWLQNNTSSGDRILIKGSRSAAMEKVLELLQQNDTTPNEGNEE